MGPYLAPTRSASASRSVDVSGLPTDLLVYFAHSAAAAFAEVHRHLVQTAVKLPLPTSELETAGYVESSWWR